MSESIKTTLGNRVTITGTFHPQGGPPADSATTAMVIRAPDGTQTPVPQGELTHLGAGVWEYKHLPDAVGRWWYHLKGMTGGVPPGLNAVGEILVIVTAPAVVEVPAP